MENPGAWASVPLRDFFAVRSDKLRELRASVAYLRKLSYPMEGTARFALVVDTNIVLGELRWLVSKRVSDGTRSSLMEIVEAETVRLYAPPALFEEVEEKIPLLAETQGLDGDAMRRHWETYRARITLAIPDEELVRSLRAGADPDDAEFVALEKTLGADGVLSKDPHISDMGGNRVPLDCVFSLRNYSRAAAVELNLRVAGVHFSIAGYAGIRACADVVGALAASVRNAPVWVRAALLAGAILVLANPRSRAKVQGAISGLLEGVSDATPYVIGLVSEAVQVMCQNQEKAKEHLAEALSDLGKAKPSGDCGKPSNEQGRGTMDACKDKKACAAICSAISKEKHA